MTPSQVRTLQRITSQPTHLAGYGLNRGPVDHATPASARFATVTVGRNVLLLTVQKDGSVGPSWSVSPRGRERRLLGADRAEYSDVFFGTRY